MAKSPVRALVPFIVRRRWRAEDARAVLARLDSSGLSEPQFAAREDLDPQRLYRWRAQLGSAGASNSVPQQHLRGNLWLQGPS